MRVLSSLLFALAFAAGSAWATDVVTPGTLPSDPAPGEFVWVDGAAAGACDTVGPDRNLCAWNETAGDWQFVQRGGTEPGIAPAPRTVATMEQIQVDPSGTSLPPTAVNGMLALEALASGVASQCTLAAGPDQVVTEGGSCGAESHGQPVILTDAPSLGACSGVPEDPGFPSLCCYSDQSSGLEPCAAGGGGGTDDQDAAEVPYTGTAPSNYAPGAAHVEGHLLGIDAVLGSVGDECTQANECYRIQDEDGDGELCDDIRSVRNEALWPGGTATTAELVRFRWDSSLAGGIYDCNVASNHTTDPSAKAVSFLHFAASDTAPTGEEEPLADGSSVLAPVLRFEGESGFRLRTIYDGDGTGQVENSNWSVALFLFGDAARDGADGAVVVDIQAFPELSGIDDSLDISNLNVQTWGVIGDGISGFIDRLTWFEDPDLNFFGGNTALLGVVGGPLEIRNADLYGDLSTSNRRLRLAGDLRDLTLGRKLKNAWVEEDRLVITSDYPGNATGDCTWGNVSELSGACYAGSFHATLETSSDTAASTQESLGWFLEGSFKSPGGDGIPGVRLLSCRPTADDMEARSTFHGRAETANALGFTALVQSCPASFASIDTNPAREMHVLFDGVAVQDHSDWTHGESEPLGYSVGTDNADLLVLGASFQGLHTGGGYPLAECHQGTEGPTIEAVWGTQTDTHSLSRLGSAAGPTGQCWTGAGWEGCGTCDSGGASCGTDSDCGANAPCNLNDSVRRTVPVSTRELHFYARTVATLQEDVTGSRGCRVDFVVEDGSGNVRAALYEQPAGTLDGFGALQCSRDPDGVGREDTDIKLGADISTSGQSQPLSANFHVPADGAYAIRVRDAESSDCPNGSSCSCDEIPAFDLALSHFTLDGRSHASVDRPQANRFPVAYEFGTNDADAFATDEDGLQCSRAAEAFDLVSVETYTDNASSSATVNLLQTTTPGDGAGTAVLSSALTPTQAGVNGTPDDVTALAAGEWVCLTIGGTPAVGETIGAQLKGTLQ